MIYDDDDDDDDDEEEEEEEELIFTCSHQLGYNSEFFFGVWVSKGSRASPPPKKIMYPSLFGHVLGISAHLKNHVALYPLNYTNLCTKSLGQLFIATFLANKNLSNFSGFLCFTRWSWIQIDSLRPTFTVR